MTTSPRAARMVLIALATLTLLSVASPPESMAQSYVKLQLLLPGETAAPGTASGRTGSPISQTVGIPFSLRIRACDGSWNTVSSITNQVSLGSSDESATLPGFVSLVTGEATVAVTLNAAGSYTISANDESDGTIPEATSSNVTILALQGFEFSRISQKNQYAGAPMNITVTAVDASGDEVTGFTGLVRLEEITSYGPGRISPETITLTGGTWTGSVTNYRADETSINRGNVNMRALLVTNPAINGTSDPFTVHPGPFSKVQIVVPGQSPAPGSVLGFTGTPATQGAGQSFVATVYAVDSYWNPLASADVVRITSSDPSATGLGSKTLVGGIAQFTVALATVGTQTLTVTDQTNSGITGTTSAPIQVTNSAPDHFEIEPFGDEIIAGDTAIVTIRAADVGGNTVPDFDGNAILTANTGPASISPELIYFTNGVWMGEVVFRGAGGAVSLTCSDFSSPPHIGSSESFVVLPGAFVGLQVLLPGQSPEGGTAAGFVGTPDEQAAGTSFTVRVRAVDAYWNRVPNVTDGLALTSTDPFAALPEEVALINGEVAFPATLFKAGTQTITASVPLTPGIASHTSSIVTVTAGTYSRILVLAPGEQSAPGTEAGRTGAATDQSINFAFTVTVYATDAWWNPIEGITDLVRVTSGDQNAQLPPDEAMINGVAEFNIRLSTGGYQQITATNLTNPGMPRSTTQVRAITSGFHLEAEITPEVVKAGETFTLNVRVTNDAGSVIQEINSLVNIEVRNGSTQEPGRGTLLNTQFQLLQGQRTIEQTYTYAEPIILIASDDLGNDPAATGVLVVEPGPPAAVRLGSDPEWLRGNRHATVNAKVVDAFENGVPAQPMSFELLSGGGVLTAIDSLTDDSGVARADYLSPRTPETARVRATSNALFAEKDLQTALVDPSASAGSVTSYPNPFHPGEAPATIAYKLGADARVSIRIYSLLGLEVLHTEIAQGTTGGLEGLNEYRWDGRSDSGRPVASGGYTLVLEAERDGETLHVMRHRIGVVR